MASASEGNDQPQPVSLLDAFKVWLKIGLLSFGGPAAQIALMHKIVVDEKRWLSEKQYLSGLSFCMLLPGPEAMQIASYAGWRLHGMTGALMAGLLFVIPGAIVIALLATVYVLYGQVDWLAGVFIGVKAAVIIIVIEALLRVAKKSLKGVDYWVIAALAFVAIFFFNIPYPYIVIAAALYGFAKSAAPDLQSEVPAVANRMELSQHFPSTFRVVLLWLAIWLLPFILLWLVGGQDFLLQVGAFFSKLAVVTFGGAYAVLAYLSQDVVSQFGCGVSRNDTRTTHSCDRVCRFSCRLQTRWICVGIGRSTVDLMGDFRTMFFVDTRRGTLHRMDQ